MPKLHRPTAVVAVTAAAILFTAGSSYAFWTVSGHGIGTVTVATVKPLVIEQVAVKSLALGSPADLNATVTNPNDFEASLLGTEITVKVTFDKGHQDCDITNFAIEAPSTEAKLITANGTLKLDKGSIKMINETTDQAACYGATLTLDYLLRQAPPNPTAKVTAAPGSMPQSAAPSRPGASQPAPLGSGEPTARPTVTQMPDATATATAAATAEASSPTP